MKKKMFKGTNTNAALILLHFGFQICGVKCYCELLFYDYTDIESR